MVSYSISGRVIDKNAGGAGGAAGSFLATAANFDGANDSLQRGAAFTGIADTTVGTFSAWIKYPAFPSGSQVIWRDIGEQHWMLLNTNGTFHIVVENTSNQPILTVSNSLTPTIPGVWNHVCYNYDTSISEFNMFVNDVADGVTASFPNSGNANFVAKTDWTIIGQNGGQRFEGDISEYWLTFGENFDISNTSNRRGFISDEGFPVDLGTDGSTPTGTSPLVFLSGDFDTWATNDGTGGGLNTIGEIQNSTTTPSIYVANAIDTGNSGNLVRGSDLTGSADGTKGTVSVWFKHGTLTGATDYIINNTNSRIEIKMGSSGVMFVIVQDSGGSSKVNMNTNTGGFDDNEWHHLLASWDTSITTGHLLIDGVDEFNSGSVTSGTLDYTVSNWYILRAFDSSGQWNDDMADLWFSQTDYFDFTDADNVFLFNDANFPSKLGSDGSLATGSPPIIYMSGDTSTWQSNNGTGGGFSLNGSFSTAATSPSDA